MRLWIQVVAIFLIGCGEKKPEAKQEAEPEEKEVIKIGPRFGSLTPGGSPRKNHQIQTPVVGSTGQTTSNEAAVISGNQNVEQSSSMANTGSSGTAEEVLGENK